MGTNVKNISIPSNLNFTKLNIIPYFCKSVIMYTNYILMITRVMLDLSCCGRGRTTLVKPIQRMADHQQHGGNGCDVP